MTELWRSDWENAPKSYSEVVPVLNADGSQKLTPGVGKETIGAGNPVTREILHKLYLWVPTDGVSGKCGTTYWIPEQNRWNGFNEGQTPHCFIALPKHYEAD